MSLQIFVPVEFISPYCPLVLAVIDGQEGALLPPGNFSQLIREGQIDKSIIERNGHRIYDSNLQTIGARDHVR